MRRRDMLVLTASALAATAGCLSEGGPEGSGSTTSETPTRTETPSRTDTPTATPAAGDVEAVALESLQPGLIELGTPDSISVFGEDEGQYLFLEVTPGAGGPDPTAFAFELDGSAYAPVEKTRRIWRRYNEGEAAEYSPDSGGWLLFELPETADDPESARLTWPDGSWQPGDAIRKRLASPTPTFDVAVDTPKTTPVGKAPSLTLSVENTGSVPGRFLAAFNHAGPNIAYAPDGTTRPLLDPGESSEWTAQPSLHNANEISDGDTTRLILDWYGGEASREVEFVTE